MLIIQHHKGCSGRRFRYLKFSEDKCELELEHSAVGEITLGLFKVTRVEIGVVCSGV